MTTIFSRIISGELPGTFVYRDEIAVCFLTINPITPGHALVVPVAEVDHWLDLDDETVAHLNVVAKRIGRAQMAALGAARVGLVIAGLEVPHTHLHVLPMHSMADLDFRNATEASPDELAAVATKLRAALGPDASE
ncbi:MAG TPA: HIT family protein [Acidimicrobiales bacterium]